MLGSVARTPSATEADTITTQQSSKSSPSQTPQTATSSKPAAQPRTKISVTPAATPAQSSQNPSKQLGVQSKSQISGEQSDPTGSSRLSRKRHAAEVDHGPSASAPQKATPQSAQPQRQESDQDFAHRVLSQIFRVSVDPHHMSDVQGQRLIFLSHLNQELNDSGEPLKLSIGNLDQAIIEACSNWDTSSPLLDCLLPCWKRAVKAANTAKNASPQRQEVIEEAKRLCMSNCLFALTMPALYGFVKMQAEGGYTSSFFLEPL